MNEANLGRFQKADPAVIADDPFWSEVRRRHPDVDIVLLPDEVPSDDSAEAPFVTLEEVRAAAVAVQEVWRGIGALLAEHGPLATPSTRWQEGDGQQSLILKKALAGIGQESGTELLLRLLVHLGERGWALHPGLRDGLPTLRATDGQVAVDAVAGPGATVVTLSSVPLAATAEDAQTVLDDLRTEVASWA